MSKEASIIVDSENEKLIKQIKKLALFLDNQIQIPGSGLSFGIDSLLGLIPGIGDGLGAAFSFYLMYLAARTGVSKRVLAKMFFNVALDSLVGVIPILGDLFDFAWKSNQKNMQLALGDLERNQRPPRENKTITRFIVFCFCLFICLITVFVFSVFSILINHLL